MSVFNFAQYVAKNRRQNDGKASSMLGKNLGDEMWVTCFDEFKSEFYIL